MNKKRLSIFLDEAGDAGKYEHHNPYYVVSFVFHNQDDEISDAINSFDLKMDSLGYKNIAIHSGPIIRKEKEFKEESIIKRIKIFKTMMAFFRDCPIKCHSIYIEKKHVDNKMEIIAKLSKLLFHFLNDHLSYFQQFDEIIVYYDNGQGLVNQLISHIFPLLLNHVTFRKVFPSQYRLFQVADMLCTMKQIELKMEHNNLSKSEITFFNDKRTIKKGYLKHINDKTI